MNTNVESSRRLIDCHEVARRLGCSWRTVYRLADTGRIPWGLKLGSLRRWDAAEIDAFIASGCRPLSETEGRSRLNRGHGLRWTRRETGETRKSKARTRLRARRRVQVRRARRAMVVHALVFGKVTADDVAKMIESPPDLDPRWRGTVPGPLVRHGILHDTGRTLRSSRPIAHARKITVWALASATAARQWLARYPNLPDPDEDEVGTSCRAPSGSPGSKPLCAQLLLFL